MGGNRKSFWKIFRKLICFLRKFFYKLEQNAQGFFCDKYTLKYLASNVTTLKFQKQIFYACGSHFLRFLKFLSTRITMIIWIEFEKKKSTFRRLFLLRIYQNMSGENDQFLKQKVCEGHKVHSNIVPFFARYLAYTTSNLKIGEIWPS